MKNDRSRLLHPELRLAQEPFSGARMRVSLYTFVVGKMMSGLTGLAWLFILVRALNMEHYGGYVVLLALLEIVVLISNAGVYPFAQRYITEARLPHNLALLPQLVWCSLAYRITTLAVVASGVAWLAKPIAAHLGQPLLEEVLTVYAFVVVFEGSVRYLELIFESLLEQGRAQLCALLRNSARLAGVFLLWYAQGTLKLVDVINIEVITSGLGLLLAVVVMKLALCRFLQVAGPQTRPADSFTLKRLIPFAFPLFVAQLLSQLYSPDSIKLVVSRLLGVAEAATFGFAHALTYVLQRYLPANLLIGLIRPVLVARRARNGNDQDLIAVANLILKINLFLLLPLGALFAVAGREFAELATGGKYGNAGPLLFLMTLLLILTGAHVVLSMLATVLEDRRAVLVGTLVSVPGIVIGISLSSVLGLMSMVLGLWLSELLWCSFTLWLLRKGGFALHIDLSASAKLFIAAVLATGVAAGLAYLLALSGRGRLTACGGIIFVVYLLACVAMTPVSLDERKMLVRLLPARWQR